jgi:hypothetical protein
MRRAERLTHEYQAGLRLQDIEEKMNAVKAKRAKENMNHQKHLDTLPKNRRMLAIRIL